MRIFNAADVCARRRRVGYTEQPAGQCDIGGPELPPKASTTGSLAPRD
jgi:hypothetical protein